MIRKIKNFIAEVDAMPDQYRVSNNAVQSYRNYYIGDKQRLATWKFRNPPAWYIF